MMKSSRFTDQKRQELISRSQLSERFIKIGWIPTPPEDLGEDFLVHIYHQGQATGVTFHVQEKSVINLIDRKKGSHLIYDFKVKDLRHWEGFNLPVVLIVWDIILREGRWMIITDVIKFTDDNRPGWRDRKYVRVYLPWKNTTSDEGLMQLQRRIGRELYSLLSKGRSLDMTLTFSAKDQVEGEELNKALNDLFEEGKGISIRGNLVADIEVSDWAKPWLKFVVGEEDLISMRYLSSSGSVEVDVNVVGLNGRSASVKNIELKVVRAGTNTIEFSNEHQATSVHFQFLFSRSEPCRCTYRNVNWGSNVNTTRDLLRFQEVVASGGSMQIVLLTTGIPFPVDLPLPSRPELSPSREFVQFVENMCLIQARSGQFLHIPVEIPTIEQIQIVKQVVTVMKHGSIITRYDNLPVQYHGDKKDDVLDAQRRGEHVSIKIREDDSYVELYGTRIDLGPVYMQVSGIYVTNDTAIEKSIVTSKEQEAPIILLKNAQVTATYPDWIQEDEI